MPTSRFDININQPYQSVRIPLPLDYLAGIAKNMQDDYDKGVHATDDASKLAATIKYSPKGAKLANDYISNAKNKINELYNSTTSYSDPAFLRRANQLTSELANDPVIQALATEKQLYDANVKESMDPNNAKNIYYTYNKDEKGNVIPAQNINELPQFNKVTKFEDYDEAYKKLLSKIAPDGNTWEGEYDLDNVKTTNNGETMVLNKSNGSYVKVNAKKLAKVSSIVLPNAIKTVAGRHQFESILRDKFGFGDNAYNYSYEDLSKKAASGDEQAALIKDTVDNEILSTVIASGAHQVGKITSSGNVQHFMDNRAAAQANDDKKFIESLTSSTVEGRTFDATQGDSNMKGLLNTGVFKNTNGVITFDQNALLKPSSTFDVKMSDGSVKNVNSYQEALDIYHNAKGASITPNDKVRTIKTNITEFNNQLIKMSNAVGIDPKSLSKDGKIDPTAISKLATSYNQLTKSRSLDLNLSPAIQNSESRNANINWYNVKQVDPNDPTTPIANTPLIADEKVVVVNRRTDKNGKVYNEGYIENTKTKEVKPVSFRSQSVEKNLVFDALGKIQKVSIDNLSKAPNKKPVMTKPINTQYGTTSMEVIGKENIGQGYYIQALTDPHNKYNTLYTIRNSNNEIVDAKQSLGDLKKSVEIFYFTRIPEGRTELENLKSSAKQAEDQQATQPQ